MVAGFLSLSLLSACSGKVPKLGLENGQLTACPDKPNCVLTIANKEEHKVEPIILNLSKNDAKLALNNAIKQLNGQIVTENENYIRAEFTSRLFRFVDDFECYLVANGNQTEIHMRSASRLGYSDFGINRVRVENLKKVLLNIVSN